MTNLDQLIKYDQPEWWVISIFYQIKSN